MWKKDQKVEKDNSSNNDKELVAGSWCDRLLGKQNKK